MRTCLVRSCTSTERLEPGIFDAGPAVSFKQLTDIQHFGAVLDGLWVAAQLVANQSPVRPELLVVLTQVDTITVQVQRLLQVSLLECGVSISLQLVGCRAPFSSVLRSLVAAEAMMTARRMMYNRARTCLSPWL